MFGSFGERAGARSTSCFPVASVTETIAKRGSTASLKVSRTSAGARADDPARRRHGAHEVGVRARRGRQHERRDARRARRRREPQASSRPLPRTSAIAAEHDADAADDERDDRERVAARRRPAAERVDRLDRRRRRVGALGAVPVDDGAVGVGLLDLERVGLRRVGLGQELEERVLLGRRAVEPGSVPFTAVQVTFWITASSPSRSACTSRFQPARGHERVDREAVGHGQHDLDRASRPPSRSARRA